MSQGEFKEHNTHQSRVKEAPGIQGTQHVAVKTEEGGESEARNRYFWLGEGASSDPRIHTMYSERGHSWAESVESSDISTETVKRAVMFSGN